MAEAAACITVPFALVTLVLVIIALRRATNLQNRLDSEIPSLHMRINTLTERLDRPDRDA